MEKHFLWQQQVSFGKERMERVSRMKTKLHSGDGPYARLIVAFAQQP